MATSILTWPPALIRFFNCFYGVWDPSNQLEAELASNLPHKLCKMFEYELEIKDFRFLEHIYIYIYMEYYPTTPTPPLYPTPPTPTPRVGGGKGGGEGGVGHVGLKRVGWGIGGVGVVG